MPASRTQPAAARWSRWPPVKPASTVTPPGVHPPVITARHARFPCCAAGHDPDGGCRPRCRRDALIHMRIRGTTIVVPLVRSVSLRVCFPAITSARHLVLGLFLPAAPEVVHERPAVAASWAADISGRGSCRSGGGISPGSVRCQVPRGPGGSVSPGSRPAGPRGGGGPGSIALS